MDEARMIEEIQEVQEVCDEDESKFLQLVDVFWFLKPTKTLIFVQDKIKSINSQEICIDEIKFETNSGSSLPKFLSTLSFFRLLGIDELNMSLDLFLQYAEKQPQDTSSILHCFVDGYGFQPDSYRYGYDVQYAVVDKMLEYCNSGKNEYFARMFIPLAENYLHTHFSSTKSGRGNTFTITQFDLAESTELLNLREKILTNLFSLYKNNNLQKYILKLILRHTQSGLNVSVKSIVEHDSKLIASFFKNDLDPKNLYHCIVVQEYLRLLKRFNISTEEKLKAQFKTSTYALYNLLTNKFERMELKLSHDAYREYKKKKIAEFTTSYSKEDYDAVLHELSNIQQTLEDHSKWQFDQGIISVLEEVAKRNPGLFCEIIKDYLQQGDYLTINPWVVVSNLIVSCGSVAPLNIIILADYPSKNGWLFSYYQHLSKDDIKKEQIDALSKLYQTADYKDFIHNVDYLLKYESVQKGFVEKIVQIVIDRSSTAPAFAHALSLVFNEHTAINKQLLSLFSSNTTLLEDAYMTFDKIDRNADHNGTTFSKLLDNDRGFSDRYLKDKFTRKKYLSSYDDNRDYSFIWLRDDYMDVMQEIAETVFKYEQEGRCFGYFESFFGKNVNPQTDKTILEREDGFLIDEISSKYNNGEFIHFLFSIIVEFESNRKLIFYKSFLDINKEFNDFEHLPIVSSTFGGWGSAVPMLQKKIEFYEKMISICNSVEYLKHRQFLEQRIQDIRHQVQHEKKMDFTEE